MPKNVVFELCCRKTVGCAQRWTYVDWVFAQYWSIWLVNFHVVLPCNNLFSIFNVEPNIYWLILFLASFRFFGLLVEGFFVNWRSTQFLFILCHYKGHKKPSLFSAVNVALLCWERFTLDKAVGPWRILNYRRRYTSCLVLLHIQITTVFEWCLHLQFGTMPQQLITDLPTLSTFKSFLKTEMTPCYSPA